MRRKLVPALANRFRAKAVLKDLLQRLFAGGGRELLQFTKQFGHSPGLRGRRRPDDRPSIDDQLFGFGFYVLNLFELDDVVPKSVSGRSGKRNKAFGRDGDGPLGSLQDVSERRQKGREHESASFISNERLGAPPPRREPAYECLRSRRQPAKAFGGIDERQYQEQQFHVTHLGVGKGSGDGRLAAATKNLREKLLEKCGNGNTRQNYQLETFLQQHSQPGE